MKRVPRLQNAMLAYHAIRDEGIFRARPVEGHVVGAGCPRPADALAPLRRQGAVRPMNAYGARAAALHLAYIGREGRENDERDDLSQRILGPVEIVDVWKSLSGALASEKHQFRFIVSPEDGGEVDLTAFTRPS
jgi:hypothetical protein